jgi:2-keto-4-pentenoate hydratase
MGCCVNVRPAHPIYDWRMPETGTLLNGNNLTNEGTALKDGDVISAGSVTVKVLIEE